MSLVLDAVRHLKPSNQTSLETGLLTTARAPVDIRTVRNASAHLNSSTMLDVDRLKIFYSGSALVHPLDLLLWRTRDTNEYAYLVWLAELEGIADAMTS
jgi:hypothetical protein